MSAPPNVTLPGVGAVDAGHDVEECRLARAVGADQAEDLVRRDVEVEMVERHHAAEPPRQTARRQHGATCARIARHGRHPGK